MTTYTSTRKRVAYCGAIVKHVYAHGSTEQKIALGDALTERTFRDRSLNELVYMAGEFGVPDAAIDRCEAETDEVVPEDTFLCATCHDQFMVQVPGHPGRYSRCPQCNPYPVDDEDAQPKKEPPRDWHNRDDEF